MTSAGEVEILTINRPQVRNALRYVLLNARHHAKNVRRRWTHADGFDRASSARWFDGWKRSGPDASMGRRFDAEGRPAVARARTWLLAVGWRRHGLLDPADVPG